MLLLFHLEIERNPNEGTFVYSQRYTNDVTVFRTQLTSVDGKAFVIMLCLYLCLRAKLLSDILNMQIRNETGKSLPGVFNCFFCRNWSLRHQIG